MGDYSWEMKDNQVRAAAGNAMCVPVLALIFNSVLRYVGRTTVPVPRGLAASPAYKVQLGEPEPAETTDTLCPVWTALGAIGRLALDTHGPFAEYLAERHAAPEGRNRDVFPLPSPARVPSCLHASPAAPDARASPF